MLIKVLKTTIASKDESGCYSKEYKKGETYNIYDDLANVFISQGWGEKLAEKKSIQELDNKAITDIENKFFTKKKKNKR
jgi:hypothetical protein